MPCTFATVSITNGLNTAIDVYDEYIADPSHPAPTQYTHLQTIAAGATGQVQCIRQSALLLATITGTVQEFAGQYYHQFPIKEMSGTQLSSGTPPPLAYTVTTADRTGAIGSFLFQRYIQANPAAELTKDFHTALTPDPTGAKTVEQSVNDFFLSTTDFKQCTYDSWINVLNWLDNFTSGWQGDYYLYKKPGAEPGLLGSPTSPPGDHRPCANRRPAGERCDVQPVEALRYARARPSTTRSSSAETSI